MKIIGVVLAACAVSAVAGWTSWGGFGNVSMADGAESHRTPITLERAASAGDHASRADVPSPDRELRSTAPAGPLPTSRAEAVALQETVYPTVDYVPSELFQILSGWWLNASAVEVGDITGDGRLDIVVLAKRSSGAPSYVKTKLYIFRQDVQGSFGAPVEIILSEFTTGMKVGDVDGDDVADIVVSTSGGLSSYIYRSDGTFQYTYTQGWGADEMGLLDVDLDGRLDVVTRTMDTSPTVRFGDGSGAFPTTVQLLNFRPGHHFAVGDITSDGFPDIVGWNAEYLVEVVPHDQIIGGRSTNYFFGESHYGTPPLAIGDFDHDGRNDVALALAKSDAPAVISFRHQDTAGALGPASALDVPEQIAALASADMNGDGRDDLVMLYGREPTKLGVLLQTPSGFAPMLSVPGIGPFPIGPAALALGDVNGDGCRDAVALSFDKVVIFSGVCRPVPTMVVCMTQLPVDGAHAFSQVPLMTVSEPPRPVRRGQREAERITTNSAGPSRKQL